MSVMTISSFNADGSPKWYTGKTPWFKLTPRQRQRLTISQAGPELTKREKQVEQNKVIDSIKRKQKKNVVDNTKKPKPFSPVNEKGSKSVSPLYFPSGVGSRSEGHFILFTVRTQAPSKLGVRKVAGSGGGASLRSQFQSNLQISEMIAMYMPHKCKFQII